MKRSDLKTGEAYYFDRSNGWEEWTSTISGKAVVVDTEPYRIVNAIGRTRIEPYAKDRRGTAVLVDLHTVDMKGEPRVRRQAVPLAQLRGPYDTTLAHVEKYRAAKREANQRAADIDAAHREARNIVRDRAQAHGLAVTGYSNTQLLISTQHLAKLLDAYDQLHGKEQ